MSIEVIPLCSILVQHRGPGTTFGQNFDFKIRRDHGKNFLGAPRL